MSFADAEAALNGAIAQDFSGPEPLTPAPPVEQAPAAPATPEGPTAPVQPSINRDEHGRFAPRESEAPAVDTTPDLFEGEAVNPDTLPAELQPLAKQLQAAFTRKTQELAAQRQQVESLGSPDELRQAAELYRNLQDPGYLQEFHAELSRALEAQGLAPGQAREEAARQIEQSTAPTTSVSDALARLKDDPELSPLAEAFSELRSELDGLKTEREREREAQELAHAQMALAGEIQRQEMAIKQSNPHYTQEDLDAIYELSAFHDGSLVEAQQRYEQIVQARLERYLNGKQATSVASAPVAGGGTSEVPTQPVDLDEALKAALGHLAEAGIDSLI